jgi:hypothetical protein
MALVGSTRSEFEYYGDTRGSYPFTIARLGTVVKAESQEKGHDEIKALHHCIQRVGADGK